MSIPIISLLVMSFLIANFFSEGGFKVLLDRTNKYGGGRKIDVALCGIVSTVILLLVFILSSDRLSLLPATLVLVILGCMAGNLWKREDEKIMKL